ncbi:hypothetical protein CC1G_15396 [Coprinopsis cinerea okayama7|uniref:Uncharacterized protein n=1 Tax=Coprinopsis cinerea (strain Okayama-7 / 130 / ATCC MYA-4618 / FGSC 9003) TaxID=240176 RepID=D6RQS6_COPC7|nr:hypothetical protein CC1G_15396 [Coprinopsis cinerea okayama7\|eukprot:XP_002910118.1 hypothetical protein CC1G_15396 [Coprinopsis cinerea okayama7\
MKADKSSNRPSLTTRIANLESLDEERRKRLKEISSDQRLTKFFEQDITEKVKQLEARLTRVESLNTNQDRLWQRFKTITLQNRREMTILLAVQTIVFSLIIFAMTLWKS